jgi:hypothetical protein
MVSPMRSVRALIEKIQSLPADRIAEDEGFMGFLKQCAKLCKTTTSKE